MMWQFLDSILIIIIRVFAGLNNLWQGTFWKVANKVENEGVDEWGSLRPTDDVGLGTLGDSKSQQIRIDTPIVDHGPND